MVGGPRTIQGKADFSHIYDRPDPRDYIRTLAELDYQIPQRARPVIDRLLRTGLGSTLRRRPRILTVPVSRNPPVSRPNPISRPPFHGNIGRTPKIRSQSRYDTQPINSA